MKVKYKISLTLIVLLFYSLLISQSIKNTKHNLSVDGPGSVKATTENEICLFCHTPHSSSPKKPLWNHTSSGSTYQLYSSSTLNASIGQPDGESILCLACHDGTIALGSVVSKSDIISFGSNVYMPEGKSKIGTNLSDDHPISFIYNNSLAIADGQLNNPSSLVMPVHLDNNSKLQCTSCHDPHKDIYNKFLHKTNENSSLCISCHNRTNWTNSTHYSSTKTWNGNGTNPWQHTSFTTVAKNACENCHNPHSAGASKSLLNYSLEENNCFTCHNSNVASMDIYSQFNKTYRHNITSYNGIHDANESGNLSSKHVECVDCHNPHQSNNQTSMSAPLVTGYLKGSKGVDNQGNSLSSVTNSYEVCYKCHTTSSWRPDDPTTRQIKQNNVSIEFKTSNPSYHPIEAKGVNTFVPSLISPWTTNSVMYCTDCHGSDGTNAPKGPHGSNYPQILKKRYERADNTTYATAKYELCFSCHSESSILGDQSFTEHDKHIREEKASCNICHDPHGVSGTSSNNKKLINFNTNVVSPSSSGKLYFEYISQGHGRCYLTCHGENHNPESY